MNKQCRQCKIIKPEVDFIRNRGNVQTLCKLCSSELAQRRVVARRCASLTKISGRLNPVCECCGESTYEFLSIDHVDNDGANNRRALGGHPNAVVDKLLESGDCGATLQVLCHNCNCGKARYTTCPHSGCGTNEYTTTKHTTEYIRRKRVRLKAMQMVSGQDVPSCACCGEDQQDFLTFDHVDNNGSAHRKEVSTSSMASMIIRGVVEYKMQVLCQNCNMAKGLYGSCPHKTGTRAINVQTPPKPHRVSSDDAAKMTEMAATGCSLRLIARETGYPHITVTRVLRKSVGDDVTNEIRARNRVDARITDSDRSAIMSLASGGAGVVAIARQVGCSHTTVRYILDRAQTRPGPTKG